MYKALPRLRLFARVEAMLREHPVLWIAAPPGAGKTTLAASYLAESARPVAWCQLDEGDADPATLFYFLNTALHEIAPQPTAPDPQQLAGQQAAPLAQRYFRDFYARLPQGAVLVLDNVQDFDWDNAGQLLETALNEVPESINVVILSREPLPGRLSRMALHGQIASLGWPDIRFTSDEAQALAELHGLRTPDLERWLALLDGWAAGIAMLRDLWRDTDPDASLALDGHDAVFRYFAGEILDRMPTASQKLLLLLSCLPGLSRGDAERLAGSQAGALLDQLFQKRLFVERSSEGAQTYHFHALFRSFLQQQARQRIEADELRNWLASGGAMLEQQGRLDDAARLYQEAQGHAALAQMLRSRAGEMLAAGRGHSWREWMSALPAELTEADPELWYWHGVSLLDAAPGRARQVLVRAAKAFKQRADDQLHLLALTAIIDSYEQEWSGLEALRIWIDALAVYLPAAGEQLADPVADLRLHTRMVLGLLLVEPESARLAPAAQQAMHALAQVDDAGEKLSAGAILLRYLDWSGAFDLAQWLVSALSRSAEDPSVSAFHRVWWYGRVARWYQQGGQRQEAEDSAGAAKAIVASFNLDPLLFQLLEATHLIAAGELGAARTLLDQIRSALPPARYLDRLEFHLLDTQWHARCGDIAAALQSAREGMALSEQTGLAWPARGRTEALLAALHALDGEREASGYWYREAALHATGHDALLVREGGQLVQAYLCAAAGEDQAAQGHLRAALGAHRLRQGSSLFAEIPLLAASIAELAFRYDIERAHMSAIVVRQNLRPRDRMAPEWPWQVAVRTLGGFELRMHGEVQQASGKAQQRPLLLLKALVGGNHGGSQNARSQKALWTQLWPDGDDPKSALNVTVHRLRKLLKADEMVTVTAGAVYLDDGALWSDIGQLAALCERIAGFARGASGRELDEAALQLLDLYRGSFCDGEEDGWILSTAARWRSRFVSAVAMLGQQLESASRWQAAIALYQRALDSEPLAETLYRGVMRCAAADSDPGTALSAYRRCKQMLSVVASLPPSGETETLAASLGFKV